jgi:hypothetical protein
VRYQAALRPDKKKPFPDSTRIPAFGGWRLQLIDSFVLMKHPGPHLPCLFQIPRAKDFGLPEMARLKGKKWQKLSLFN